MDSISLLKYLVEITKQKHDLLQSVYQLTCEQYQVILSKNLDEFAALCGNKEEVIDKVNRLDEVFDRCYQAFKRENDHQDFRKLPDEYRSNLYKLQESIVRVRKLIDEIKRIEENNSRQYAAVLRSRQEEIIRSMPNKLAQIAQYKKLKQLKKDSKE